MSALISSTRRRPRGGASLRRVLRTLLVLAVVVAYGWWEKRSLPENAVRVDHVQDGDSFVYQREGERQVVRLYGIDAPEKGQAFGAESRARSRELVLNQPVTLVVHDVDGYDREVAEVRLEDGRILNEVLVGEGLAWWYQRHAEGNRTLARLERTAREEQRGLWAEDDPTPPWEFRSRGREGR